MTPDGAAVLYAAARWLGYLAAFLLMGAAVTRQVLLPRVIRPPDDAAPAAAAIARLGVFAGLALLLAQAGRLYWQARSLLESEDQLTREFLGLVLGSDWGRGWSLQTGAALLAVLGWAAARNRRAAAAGVLVASAAALLYAIVAPFTGHAVALPQAGRIGIALDALHFAAGGAWLGTLGVVALVGLRKGSPLAAARVPELISAFSPVALVSGSVAMAAGAVIGYRYLGGLEPLWTTSYGRALALKLLLLGGVAALGAINWRVVLPRLRRDADPGPVRRTARLELALGALLLAVTAVLVALPAPGEE